jgi:hypothetical protein
VDADLVEDALTEPHAGGGHGGDGDPAHPDGAGNEPERAGATGEMDRALALLRRRFPTPVGDRRERERALGVLLRKGYDSELALEAIASHTRELAPADYA